MNWLEITANTEHNKLDTLCDRLEALGVEGLVINDEAVVNDFLENGRKYWDYVDDDVICRMKGVCSVQFYLEDSDGGRAELARLQAALPTEKFSVKNVKDEDWENNWREYYKPIKTGERLIIVPEWETVPEGSSRTPLRLDPGLIFGTGSHATTRMCLERLENYCGKRVLDLGCGSGILSIAALILGAKSAVGCDIDDKAPSVAMGNGALNGIGRGSLTVYTGDILSDAVLKKKIGEARYDIVLANIVADVIIAMAPEVTGWLAPGGVFICSGIIDGRQDEVKSSLTENGLRIIRSEKLDGWHCFTAAAK